MCNFTLIKNIILLLYYPKIVGLRPYDFITILIKAPEGEFGNGDQTLPKALNLHKRDEEPQRKICFPNAPYITHIILAELYRFADYVFE